MTRIFATCGTQLPFPRLLTAIDNWIDENNSDIEFIVQSPPDGCTYRNFELRNLIPPAEYEEIVAGSDLLIGHAGIGTIITAHEHNLPLIIFPRKFKFGEHRNDHQMTTIERFSSTPGVYSAEDEPQLSSILKDIDNLNPCDSLNSDNRAELFTFLGDFLS